MPDAQGGVITCRYGTSFRRSSELSEIQCPTVVYSSGIMSLASGRRKRRLIAIGLFTAGLAALSGSLVVSRADAAQPIAFDSVSGTCVINSAMGYGESQWSTGVQTVGRDTVLARGEFSSGEGQFSVGELAIGGYGGPDTAWVVDSGFYAPPAEAGKQIRGNVSCFGGPTSYSISFFEPPSAPTEFAGRITPSAESDTTSQVAFRAPTSGSYQAAVSVTTGVARVDGQPSPINGYKTIDLGTVRAGELRPIDIEALGISPTTWSLAVSRFMDVIAPTTRITLAPRITSKRRVVFRFQANERADFECRIDRGRFVPCGSPYVSKRLGNGFHRFFVRATDASGNVETPAASRRFRIVKKR